MTRYTFHISALNVKAGALTELSISPNRAAKIERDAFLAFAEEVERTAAKLRNEATEILRAEEAQLRMF